MEFGLASDASAYAFDDFMCQFSGFFLFAVNRCVLHQFHAEAFFYASEIEILAIDAPHAWTDVVEYPCRLAAFVEVDDINLTCRVEGASVVVEIHGAGFVYVDITLSDVVVPAMFISVMTFHLRVAT